MAPTQAIRLGPDFGRPLCLSGPSGTGKSTLLKRLFAEFPDKFGFSVSHTTRAPRPGEENGREYHFVSADEFARLQAEGAFLETATFSGNQYGTSFAAVRALGAGGRRAILDIEAQGVRQVKASALDPVYVFLAPPSVGALRARLAGRGTDAPDAVAKRLRAALDEAAYAREGAHDVVVVNDSVERAYALLREVALGVRIVGDALPPLDDE